MNKTHQHLSWGNYPKLYGTRYNLDSSKLDINTLPQPFISQGNLRSYGDSALSENMLSALSHNKILSFDRENGIVHCQSGVLIRDIIEQFLPYGWFPMICPGTQDVTIGGAIACDIHGKNHHHEGAFSECLIEFTLLNGKGELLSCNREENADWFHASCGGMGLTGIFMDAKIQLKKVESTYINQYEIKTTCLKDTLEKFEQANEASYSVAWIDCLGNNNKLGRGILSTGEHSNDECLKLEKKSELSLPFYLPGFSLNRFTLKAFNTLYYQKTSRRERFKKTYYHNFFFPLDSIMNWNRIYGHPGLLQYQFVIPFESSLAGLTDILTTISKSKQTPNLAVLKLLGEQNNNPLSFPMKGFTLALDFKNTPKVHTLLNTLDNKVNEFGGRVYLAKDARISRESFEPGYPELVKFRTFRKQQGLREVFESAQSKRLDL